LTRYPNGFKPQGHTVTSYFDSKEKKRFFLSYGGTEDSQHLLLYDSTANTWQDIQKHKKINFKKLTENHYHISCCARSVVFKVFPLRRFQLVTL